MEDYKLDPPQSVSPGPAQHPGPWIRSALLEPYGVTKVTEAAELLHVQRGNLNHVLNGNQPVTADLAYRFEALTGVDPVLLLAMQAGYDRDTAAAKREAYKAQIQRLELPKAEPRPSRKRAAVAAGE